MVPTVQLEWNAYTMTNNIKLAIDALITLSRADYDATAKAEKTRGAFIDQLIAAGFTHANTVPAKKGSNVDPVWRKALTLICAGTIKIKGKRLSDTDLKKLADEEVSNKVLLQGTPKGTMNGVTTWLGNAASYIGKVRIDLEKREGEAQDVAGTPKTPSTDTEIILGYLQKAYTKTFKDDVNLKCDLSALQKEMREVAKVLGADLKTPQAKKK
jgi:hypothetical protein